MITTNLITFEVYFKNSSDTYICNVTNNSLTELAKIIKNNGYIFDRAKEFQKSQSKFKSCPKKRFLNCINFNTELFLLIG